VSEVPASPPESAIQILQHDGFPPAFIALPLPPNTIDMAVSPADINNDNDPQTLVIVFNSPSAARRLPQASRKAWPMLGTPPLPFLSRMADMP
jgi:hypothetical protein